MLEHAYYSVISPEGCAGILWKTANEETKPRAAEALRLTSRHLKELGVIDDVIPEPLGGGPPRAAGNGKHSQDLPTQDPSRVAIEEGRWTAGERYDKFRQMGVYIEPELDPAACPERRPRTMSTR